MRNWIQKSICSIFILFVAVLAVGNVAQAGRIASTQLEEGKFYYYDLDNDGKSEKIKISSSYKQVGTYNHKYKYSIYINDTCAYTSDWYDWYDYYGYFYLTDINSKDSYKEICVEQIGDSDWNERTDVLRYKNKKLTMYFHFSGGELADKQPGKGKIRLQEWATFDYSDNLGRYYVYVDYKISKKKLKRVANHVFQVDRSMEYAYPGYYKLSRAVKIRRGIKNGKTKYTIKRGTGFYLMKLYVSNNKVKYLYIKTTNGKKGWIKLPKGKFVKETYGWS